MWPVPGPMSSALCGVRGWHKERVASVQGEGSLPLDHHLHCPREDVSDFFTCMDVPAGLDAAGNLGEHLHDLSARD